MTGPFATRLFRIAFVLAGAYNLAFGAWTVLWPRAFFDLFEVAPPRYPVIWSCLGMVVGVYGFLYVYAAWKPERGRPLIAVGLLGKVVGPIGMFMTFGDDWPPRLGMLCVTNDLIWWLPFSLFLLRGSPAGRRLAFLAPWICAALHVLAVAMLVVLGGGTETEPDPLERAAYITEHSTAWRLGWMLWMTAAASLVGFYAAWGSRLAATGWAGAATLLAACGMVCDLTGESLYILVLVEQAAPVIQGAARSGWDVVGFQETQRLATLLTAGVANGLYTVGGVILTLGTPRLPRWVGAAMWTTWLAGLVMSASALLDSTAGMVAATALLFPLLITWTVWMAWRWRRA